VKLTKLILLIFIIFVLPSSCAPRLRTLSEIDPQMGEDDVKQKLGKPISVKGVIVNKYNQKIEVWEYYLYEGVTPSFACYHTSDFDHSYKVFWLYFANNKLVKAREATGWSKEVEDDIYETKF